MANLEYKHEGIYSSLVIKGLKTPYMDFYCQWKQEAKGDDLDEVYKGSETYIWKLIT